MIQDTKLTSNLHELSELTAVLGHKDEQITTLTAELTKLKEELLQVIATAKANKEECEKLRTELLALRIAK